MLFREFIDKIFQGVIMLFAIILGLFFFITQQIFGFLLQLCIVGLIIWIASWIFPSVASFFIEWISWFLEILLDMHDS